MGSASDSGQKTGNSDSEPETLSEKSTTVAQAVGLTYEQIQQNSKTKRPKRNGSTLSRFSNIFKSDGKKLADSLTEEFHLNDRFSGLSMDRIWGGFLQQLNAEEEKDSTSNTNNTQVSRLDTIEENQESAGTGTEDSIRETQQQRQRRRRRRQRKHVQRADSWQKELPADWQNVLSI